MLWHCWLGSRKGIRPLKTWVVGAGMVICLERGADLHMAQLMPLSVTVSCFSKIHISFTFLVPADPGSPGQRAVKRMCVSFNKIYSLVSAVRKVTTAVWESDCQWRKCLIGYSLYCHFNLQSSWVCGHFAVVLQSLYMSPWVTWYRQLRTWGFC